LVLNALLGLGTTLARCSLPFSLAWVLMRLPVLSSALLLAPIAVSAGSPHGLWKPP
jgi:hypothetical protein